MEEHYDVIVVGGGTAGAIAAIQAGRAGARTLLVEKNGMLGGTTTVAAVDFPGLFHAWGKQVIAGIGWELVTQAVALAGDTLPDFSDYHRPHYLLQVRVNAGLYAALVDEAALAAGVNIRFHTMLAEVKTEDDGWRLLLCGLEGLHSVWTRVLIDCTGDANAVALAGYARVRNVVLQPGTLVVRCSGYHLEALDLPALDAAAATAVTEGRLLSSDFGTRERPVSRFLRNRGANAMHVVGIDGSTSAGRSEAEIKGRQAMLRIYRFLRTLPGLERFTIDFCATECGIRETYTIVGKRTITAADYTGARLWDDAVSYSFYPIDVHKSDGHGIDIRPLAEGMVPTIPRGALLPQGSRRLLVAGRCAAGDKEANSAYRVQASAMGMGQAAGALAVLACRGDCDVEDVPIPELHDLLEEYGAIVPGRWGGEGRVRRSLPC